MYSTAHLHLLINHFPIIVPPIALVFLAVAWLRRSEFAARAGLALLVAGAFFALPSYLTGDGAEDAVRRAPGVTRDIIHQHSSAALIGALALGALGIVALWALWRYREPLLLPRPLMVGALVASAATSLLMAWVGLLGGAIRHTEVRADPPAAFGVGAPTTPDSGRQGPP